ncbi:MAG: Zn-dependent alcohol dehydrogenase [Acidimicrobiales bacterium]
MRAAVLREAPGDLVVEEADVADPGPHEVRIANAAAGLCHSDLHFMDGTYPWILPAVLGHESAGVVEAVGEDVTYVAPGDHVITCVSVFCGECEQCLGGRPALCSSPSVRPPAGAPPRLTLRSGEPLSQFSDLGSFAEELLVHERAVVKIPRDVPLDRAALVGCGVITGVGAVFNTAQVRPGTTVAVVGCGGIGLNCVQGARIAGALRVIAVDVQPWKLELATTFGATDVVDAGAGDPVAQVRELTGGGVDYSFEAIGTKGTVEQVYAMARPGGTATVIGMVPLGTKVEIEGADFLSERRLLGCLMGSNRFRTEMPRILELYRQGRLLLDELVTSRISLDGLNAAAAELRAGSIARSVVVFPT